MGDPRPGSGLLPQPEALGWVVVKPDQLAQPLTSHPIPIAIEVAVPLPQQLLGPGKRADLLAGGVGPTCLLGYGADDLSGGGCSSWSCP
jgi:hypothetical protein